jgi:hypothetical protein
MSREWTSWKCALLMRSPLHIGWHRLGLIERTRFFVPAKNVWGMLVSHLAPLLNPGMPVPAIYTQAQKDCLDSLRFTPLFLAPSPDCAETEVWRPKYTDGGLTYGDRAAADFELDLVDSSAFTAIDPSGQAAEQGALHEVEFLRNYQPGAGAHRPVALVGYIFLRAPLGESRLRNALAEARVGAERRYGWGRVSLVRLEPASERVFGEFEFAAGQTAADPTIRPVGETFYVPAHLGYQAAPEDGGHHSAPELKNGDAKAATYRGDLEAVVGREWANGPGDRGGAGQDLTRARLCWAPGSQGRQNGEHASPRYAIDGYGFWHAA